MTKDHTDHTDHTEHTDHTAQRVRQTLQSVALDHVRAPADLAEKVVRRRSRRRFAQIAGAAAAVTAVTVGAVFGFGGGPAPADDRSEHPATTPDDWRPWQSEVRGASEHGCELAGTDLYCSGTKHDLAKFDANTGDELWKVPVNGEGNGPNRALGPRDGMVVGFRNHTDKKQPNGDYMGGTDVMGVDADSGTVRWTVKMPHDDRTDQAAMLIDDGVLAATPTTYSVSALSIRTGKTKWTHTWPKDTNCERASVDGVPYLTCIKTKTVADPDRTEVIRLDPATGEARTVRSLPGGHHVAGVSAGRLVLHSSQDANGPAPGKGKGKGKSEGKATYAWLTLLTESGEVISNHTAQKGSYVSSDVVGDRLYTVSGKGRAEAYDLSTGKRLWNRSVGIRMPADDTMLFISAPAEFRSRGHVYFFGPYGDLAALDRETGERVWSGRTEAVEPGSGPGQGAHPRLFVYGDVFIAAFGPRITSYRPDLPE
ncbi:outer membrane biogenesis protein BamB [Streptomyces sp. YIM 130001]|uniref:PQQ-binding-like beta-propeller repeat protein n=1 Tax=Streptomyces sp. YIM 130001 TaxID=2259644 RepID=UPI000E64BD48|nr:PQQ-binding-like beta-propeller repeat protein [Streptomyces sp. YIM 130001]RII11221.1 outer membrane biogenesis protein BamB [Streptomyces sp. YIM 130001]